MSGRPHRSVAACRLVALLTWLLLLPGCVTAALWESHDDSISRAELLGEHKERSEGNLERTESAVVWRGLDGGEVWAQPIGASGELAMAVLAMPEFCEVLDATLERVRVTCDAEVLEESSHLELMIRLRRGEIAEVVFELDLRPEVRALLAIGSMVEERAPLSFRQCANQLSCFNLNWLVGRVDEFVVTSMVFVDADGAPPFAGLGGCQRGANAGLEQRLQKLSRMSLLTRLKGVTTTVVLKLKPDRVWLASMLSMGAGRGSLRTPVVLQQSGSGERTPGSQVVAVTYLQHLTRYKRVTYEDESLSIWTKLALTPAAIVVDVVFGVLWECVTGGGDDDDDDEAGVDYNSSRKIGARRSGESEQQWRARVHHGQTRGH